MGTTDNIDKIWRFYKAGPSESDAEREQFFAADAIWHVPGDNPVSGDYRGLDAIVQEIGARMEPLDSWTIEPRHVMANGNYAVAVAHIKGERRGHRIDMHGAHVFRFNDEGLIVEAWGFTDDQEAVDVLLSA
jgi:ketosteroid isomerase-like protein